jgi:Streptomycin adenylyltransferase.
MPYAIAHLGLMRQQLVAMLIWQVGLEKGFTFSIGKQFKYLQRHLNADAWQRLCDTWNAGSQEAFGKAVSSMLALFREVSKHVTERFGYEYPEYDAKVSRYLGKLPG